VNDLPDFLHGKNREICQHIRITYVTDKPAARGRDWLRRYKRVGLPPAAPPSRRTSYCPTTTHTVEGKEFLNVTQVRDRQQVDASCVEAAFSLLTTRGRLLWLYRSLCFMFPFECNSNSPPSFISNTGLPAQR